MCDDLTIGAASRKFTDLWTPIAKRNHLLPMHVCAVPIFPESIFYERVCMDVPFTRAAKNYCSKAALLTEKIQLAAFEICCNLLSAPTVILPSISPTAS